MATLRTTVATETGRVLQPGHVHFAMYQDEPGRAIFGRLILPPGIVNGPSYLGCEVWLPLPKGSHMFVLESAPTHNLGIQMINKVTIAFLFHFEGPLFSPGFKRSDSLLWGSYRPEIPYHSVLTYLKNSSSDSPIILLTQSSMMSLILGLSYFISL